MRICYPVELVQGSRLRDLRQRRRTAETPLRGFRARVSEGYKHFGLHVITNVITFEFMVFELKLRKVGNSVGLLFPKEALARLNVEEGDAVYLTETTEGDFRVTANNPGFAEKMKVAERLSRKYRHALKELAK